MWKSRSVAEPKITLNKHKTSSPFGVSALYSGVKQDGRPQSIGPVLLTESQTNSPSGHSPSDQACLCQGSCPWGLLFCGRAQSASEQACCQWAGSPRDQPLEREGGPASWRGLESRPYIQTVILTGLGVGNSFANLKILCFPEQTQARSVIFIYNKWAGPV